jgi:hypothetical protein
MDQPLGLRPPYLDFLTWSTLQTGGATKKIIICFAILASVAAVLWNGTKTIYSGSGFGKISVPVQVPVLEPIPEPDHI